MPFQTEPNMNLTGTVDSLQVFDSGPTPNTIIRRNETWSVQVDWHISGGGLPFIGGQWEVQVLLESYGQGFEGTVGSAILPVNNAAGTYTVTISMPAAATAPVNTQPGAGAYKLVVLILHSNYGVQTRMAGFREGGLLHFFDAP